MLTARVHAHNSNHLHTDILRTQGGLTLCQWHYHSPDIHANPLAPQTGLQTPCIRPTYASATTQGS